jgi:hemolysin III
MAAQLSALVSLAPHDPRPAERVADVWVHVVGLAAAGAGAATLLILTLVGGRFAATASVGVYGLCLVAMLVCSTLYNISGPRWRPVLRRLDHAGVFLMIAGSYTPFTTQCLTGAWAVWMTLAVWTLSLIAVKPLLATVSLFALVLLLAGGLV